MTLSYILHNFCRCWHKMCSQWEERADAWRNVPKPCWSIASSRIRRSCTGVEASFEVLDLWIRLRDPVTHWPSTRRSHYKPTSFRIYRKKYIYCFYYIGGTSKINEKQGATLIENMYWGPTYPCMSIMAHFYIFRRICHRVKSKISWIHYTVKKSWPFSRPQPGCHWSNSSWAGII